MTNSKASARQPLYGHLYQWIGTEGQSGYVIASSRHNALVSLIERQLVPITLTRLFHISKRAWKKRLPKLQTLMEQLFILLSKNVKLVQALEVFSKNEPDFLWQYVVTTIADKLRSGHSFSGALQDYPIIFSNFFCAMITAGEATGDLKTVIQLLGHYQAKQNYLIRQIRKLTLYPRILFIFGLLLVIGMLVAVIPQFECLYANYNVPLPKMSKGVLWLSHIVRHKKYPCILGIGSLSLLKHHSSDRNIRLKRWWNKLSYQLPVIGNFLQYKILFQLLRALSITQQSGIPILQAFEISKEIMEDTPYEDCLNSLCKRLPEGFSIASELSKAAAIPRWLIQLIALGESTDSLATTWENAAQFCEELVNKEMEKCIALVEPTAMLLVSLVLGILIISIYLPIFQLGTLIQ